MTQRRGKPAKRLIRAIFDGGNADVKALCGDIEKIFVHAVAEIEVSTFHKDVERESSPENRRDFILMRHTEGTGDKKKTTERAFVVGKTAQRYTNLPPRTGAAKYTPDYYRVLAASAMSRVFEGQSDLLKKNTVEIGASHASRDYEHAPAVKYALIGDYNFLCGDEEFKFTVDDVKTYEEPFGGFINATTSWVTKRGESWWGARHGHPLAGVIDIGGGTIGIMQVEEDGSIDFNNRTGSSGQGINNVIARVNRLLFARYADSKLRGVSELPRRELAQAVSTGWISLKGTDVDIGDIVAEATAPLLNDVMTLWSTYLGSGAALRKVYLTGGGMYIAGMTIKTLLELDGFEPSNIHFAESVLVNPDPESPKSKQIEMPARDIRFANVRGMQKFYAAQNNEPPFSIAETMAEIIETEIANAKKKLNA